MICQYEPCIPVINLTVQYIYKSVWVWEHAVCSDSDTQTDEIHAWLTTIKISQ